MTIPHKNPKIDRLRAEFKTRYSTVEEARANNSDAANWIIDDLWDPDRPGYVGTPDPDAAAGKIVKTLCLRHGIS